MIRWKPEGDIFKSDCDGLVNPVNCEGIMGGGLAYAFARRFPEMNLEYEDFCERGLLRPGMIHTWKWNDNGRKRFILNLPTKDLIRNDSTLRYVSDGIDKLIQHVERYSMESVAIPALGCGLGGLEWNDVCLLLVNKLSHLNFRSEIYLPKE